MHAAVPKVARARPSVCAVLTSEQHVCNTNRSRHRRDRGSLRVCFPALHLYWRASGTFHTFLSNFCHFECVYRCFNATLFYSKYTRAFWNKVVLLPLTTKMAEVDRLSTSVSITQTYFPPWFSWMLRIIRSPDILYKTWLKKKQAQQEMQCYFITQLLAQGFVNIYNAFHNHSVSRPRIFSHLFKHQQPTWQMYSAQITLLAVLQALPDQPASQPSCKQTPATHRTHKINTVSLIGKAFLIIL